MGWWINMDRRILRRCSLGKRLDSEVRRYASPEFDDIKYVDVGYGSDGNDGESWDTPVATINKALDLLEYNSSTSARGRHQAIMFQSRQTYGNRFTAQQIIDLPNISLIGGHGPYGVGGWGSVFCIDGNNLTSDSDFSGLTNKYAGLAVEADGVSIRGIRFYVVDPTNNPWCVVFNDAHDARFGSVIDCQFQADGAGGSHDVGGICFHGSETGLAARNQMYYMKRGIRLCGGGIRYCSKTIVEDNVIHCPEYGIHLSNSSVTENLIQRNRILPKQVYGYTFVRGIHLVDAAQGNCFEGNRVFHGTEGTAYHAGSGTNYWILNYYGTIGGTMFDGAD